MTHEDIIEMGREAGLIDEMQNGRLVIDFHEPGEELFDFAARVIAAEREACAKVCESLPLEWVDQPAFAQTEIATMIDCASAIRAREQ